MNQAAQQTETEFYAPRYLHKAAVAKDKAEEDALGSDWRDTAHVQTNYPKKKHLGVIVHSAAEEAQARSDGFFDLPNGTDFEKVAEPVPADQVAVMRARIAELEARLGVSNEQKGPAVQRSEAPVVAPAPGAANLRQRVSTLEDKVDPRRAQARADEAKQAEADADAARQAQIDADAKQAQADADARQAARPSALKPPTK